jgi:DNA-binding NtrC family response regulator
MGKAHQPGCRLGCSRGLKHTTSTADAMVMTGTSERGSGAGRSWTRGGGGGADAAPDRVLVLDDSDLRAATLVDRIRAWGHFVQHARLTSEVSGIMDDPRLAVVLLGSSVQSAEDVPVLEFLRARRPDVAVLAMSRRPSLEGALACLRRGAFDFLVDPEGDDRELRAALRRALARRRERSSSARQQCDAQEDVPLSLDAYEKLALERALRESDGDATTAAGRLGIGRSTFYRKAARHGIELSSADVLRRRADARSRLPLRGGVGATGPIS